jgi:D-aminopeptidase
VERAARVGAGLGDDESPALATLDVAPPVVIDVEYATGALADHGALLPGAERIGDRGVRYRADDPVLAFRGFLAINRLAGSVR